MRSKTMDGLRSVVESWLNDCETTDISQLTEHLRSDHERLMHAIFSLCEDRSKFPDLFESVVKQLFALAKSDDDRLREFVLLLAPSLLYIYFSCISFGDKKSVSSVELVLLALYNTEVVDCDGKPKMASFRLPSLARQSVYHEPASLAPASFTVDSLQRLEAGDTEAVRWGPPLEMTSVNASTRSHLASSVMMAYNTRLSTHPKISLVYLCRSISKIVCQGFSKPLQQYRTSLGTEASFGAYPRPVPRIPVTSEFLVELLHAVYFAMPAEHSLLDLPPLMSVSMPLAHFHYSRFNEFASLGSQALEDIHMRAQYELFGDVLIMTNAIKHSLKVNISGQPSDGPMGISVALTPVESAGAPLSKSIITNASFRTKKLPDDIPIQRPEAANEKPLMVISEEGEEDGVGKTPIRTPQGSGREKEGKEKSKFMPTDIQLPTLVKKKDKEKNRNGERRDSERKEKEKKEKQEKERQEKEKQKEKENRSNGSTSSNRNSVVVSSDSDGGDIGKVSSQGSLQVLEMKVMGRPSPPSPWLGVDDGAESQVSVGASESEASEESEIVFATARSPLEVNGSEQYVAKVA